MPSKKSSTSISSTFTQKQTHIYIYTKKNPSLQFQKGMMVTLRLAEALQRNVIFCRWLRWPQCLGGDSRAGMLLLVQMEPQGCRLPSSPQAGVCVWAGVAAGKAWSLEDSVVRFPEKIIKHMSCVIKIKLDVTRKWHANKSGCYIFYGQYEK